MTDREFEDHIYDLKSRGSIMGLSRIRALLKALGDPQDDIRVIHIAGTNGKGSVLAMCESILSKAGYKVGSFSSPALLNDKDSIRFCQKSIPAKTYRGYFEKIDEIGEAEECTFFECLTAVSFMYFKDKKADVVILECGMGGRDDSTNVIKRPVMSVITSISMDHSDVLGKTLPEIADAKCGIIKNDSVVVSAPQVEEVKEVIVRAAEEKDCEIVFAKAAEKSKGTKEVRPGGYLKVSYSDDPAKGRYEHRLSLTGDYQLINAGVVFKVVEKLREAGFTISEDAVDKGLLETRWPGRFECISKKPLVYCDGAHNVAGAKALRKTIERDLKGKRLIFVMGVFKDKDYEGIAAATCDMAESVITIKAPGPRGLDSYELAGTVLKFNKNVTAAGSVEEACELALLLARTDGVIVAFGSLSYLSLFTECMTKSSMTKTKTINRK